MLTDIFAVEPHPCALIDRTESDIHPGTIHLSRHVEFHPVPGDTVVIGDTLFLPGFGYGKFAPRRIIEVDGEVVFQKSRIIRICGESPVVFRQFDFFNHGHCVIVGRIIA